MQVHLGEVARVVHCVCEQVPQQLLCQSFIKEEPTWERLFKGNVHVDLFPLDVVLQYGDGALDELL